jgi:hypothetical protein
MDESRAASSSDLFAEGAARSGIGTLTVFRAELIAREQTTWDELFHGFTTLRAITFPAASKCSSAWPNGWTTWKSCSARRAF